MSRRPHLPTPETKKTVEAMIACGIPHEEVAKVIGISADTLVKKYRDEIDTASAKANSRIAQSLYRNAMEGNVAAQIFWLKTRARWRETSHVEVTGADSGPVRVSADVPPKETYEEWEARQRREQAIAAAALAPIQGSAE